MLVFPASALPLLVNLNEPPTCLSRSEGYRLLGCMMSRSSSWKIYHLARNAGIHWLWKPVTITI